MKLRIQAQNLQAGDIVGSGEKVIRTIINSTQWPSNKILVELEKLEGEQNGWRRNCYWGKYTMINVERQ